MIQGKLVQGVLKSFPNQQERATELVETIQVQTPSQNEKVLMYLLFWSSFLELNEELVRISLIREEFVRFVENQRFVEKVDAIYSGYEEESSVMDDLTESYYYGREKNVQITCAIQ
ncbi:CFC_HP_G0068350.mRNA.1.CDS.1 [Saccharomyces cerevisiae]|nr:CFC_HP_G0068350.mRNA.1.CDS.1 [Saccharomyces cerevisiae]CAI6648813.1 CFC_HP_G0068350.mRNA.1.CDS.1 [Saccharomyces cerevisiae]